MSNKKKFLERLKKNDSTAQIELIKKYNSRIFLYFKIRIKGEDDYEDLVQEVFTSFFYGVQKNKIIEDKFIGPFIFGIAKRVVYNYFYKKKRNESIKSRIGNELEISYDFAESNRLENEKLSEIINKIIDGFSGVDKTILKEFYLKENDVGDVAEMLGKSKHYVSVRKQRAIKKIKNEILKGKDLYNI